MMESASTLTPLMNWTATQEATQHRPEKTSHKEEMTGVFLEMLKGTMTNPLSAGDPGESLRLMQGLTETQMRADDNEKLDNMEKALALSNTLLAAGLTGGNGTWHSNTFVVAKDSVPTVSYHVPQNADLNQVVIRLFKGSDGTLIDQRTTDGAAGTHALKGLADHLREDSYFVEATGLTHNGKQVPIKTLVSAPITSIQNQDGTLKAGWQNTWQPLDQLKGFSGNHNHGLGQTSSIGQQQLLGALADSSMK